MAERINNRNRLQYAAMLTVFLVLLLFAVPTVRPTEASRLDKTKTDLLKQIDFDEVELFKKDEDYYKDFDPYSSAQIDTRSQLTELLTNDPGKSAMPPSSGGPKGDAGNDTKRVKHEEAPNFPKKYKLMVASDKFRSIDASKMRFPMRSSNSGSGSPQQVPTTSRHPISTYRTATITVGKWQNDGVTTNGTQFGILFSTNNTNSTDFEINVYKSGFLASPETNLDAESLASFRMLLSAACVNHAKYAFPRPSTNKSSSAPASKQNSVGNDTISSSGPTKSQVPAVSSDTLESAKGNNAKAMPPNSTKGTAVHVTPQNGTSVGRPTPTSTGKGNSIVAVATSPSDHIVGATPHPLKPEYGIPTSKPILIAMGTGSNSMSVAVSEPPQDNSNTTTPETKVLPTKRPTPHLMVKNTDGQKKVTVVTDNTTKHISLHAGKENPQSTVLNNSTMASSNESTGFAISNLNQNQNASYTDPNNTSANSELLKPLINVAAFGKPTIDLTSKKNNTEAKSRPPTGEMPQILKTFQQNLLASVTDKTHIDKMPNSTEEYSTFVNGVTPPTLKIPTRPFDAIAYTPAVQSFTNQVTASLNGKGSTSVAYLTPSPHKDARLPAANSSRVLTAQNPNLKTETKPEPSSNNISSPQNPDSNLPNKVSYRLDVTEDAETEKPLINENELLSENSTDVECQTKNNETNSLAQLFKNLTITSAINAKMSQAVLSETRQQSQQNQKLIELNSKILTVLLNILKPN